MWIFINEKETIININYSNKDNNENNIYKFCTGIKGKLIEVNKNIINNNNIIKEQPLGNGFICNSQKFERRLKNLKKNYLITMIKIFIIFLFNNKMVLVNIFTIINFFK